RPRAPVVRPSVMPPAHRPRGMPGHWSNGRRRRSSMSRRDRNQLNKAFGAQPAPTTHEIDEALYGDFVTLDDGRMDAEPISIFNIQPDLSQPRRTVVSACRHFWDGQPDNIP